MDADEADKVDGYNLTGKGTKAGWVESRSRVDLPVEDWSCRWDEAGLPRFGSESNVIGGESGGRLMLSELELSLLRSWRGGVSAGRESVGAEGPGAASATFDAARPGGRGLANGVPLGCISRVEGSKGSKKEGLPPPRKNQCGWTRRNICERLRTRSARTLSLVDKGTWKNSTGANKSV